MPGVDPKAHESRALTALELTGVLGVIFPPAIPSLAFGWVLERRHEWNARVRHGLAIGALLAAGLVVIAASPGWHIVALGEFWAGIVSGDINQAAGGAIRLVPFSVTAGTGLGMLLRRLHEHELRSHPVRGVEVTKQREARQMSHRASVYARVPTVPLTIDGLEVVGAWLGGDAEACRRGSWAVLPAGSHLVAIGASGSGKTTAISQIVRASMLGDGRRQRVIFIDGKEDQETGFELARIALGGGMSRNAIRLWPLSGPMDLWRGSAQELADRFHALADFTEPFYESIARTAAKLSIDDPRGLPRSLDEILSRMESAALKATWAGTPNAEVASKLTAELLGGVRLRYFALSAALRNIGAIPDGPGGWSYEDAAFAHIALPTSTTPLVAAGFGRALLLDFVSYIRNSQRRVMTQPLLCVIEELGAIIQRDPVAAASVVETLERARSAGVRMVLSGQVLDSFGEPQTQTRLLTSGATILAMRMADPEPILNLLGTRARPEASIGVGADGGLLDQGSLRMQEQWAVDPQFLRTAEAGRGVLIHQGRFALVQVPPPGTSFATSAANYQPPTQLNRLPLNPPK